MKRAILFPILTLLLWAPVILAQSTFSSHGKAIIIYKYQHSVQIWTETKNGDGLFPGSVGTIYRTFATGPKLVHGDERLPNGIHEGRIGADGNISFVFETYPGLPAFDEVYHFTGPTLDRHVISVKDGFIEELLRAGREMRAAGYNTIPIVIFPGELEPEVAGMLERTKNVRKGQTLDDVKRAIDRWRPVEDHLIEHGRIPVITFDRGTVVILPPENDTRSVSEMR